MSTRKLSNIPLKDFRKFLSNSKIINCSLLIVVLLITHYSLFIAKSSFLVNPSPIQNNPAQPTHPSDTVLARQYFQKAKNLQDAAQYDSSTAYLKKAANIYKVAEVWDQYLACYNGIGGNYMEQGTYDAALSILQTNLQLGIKYLGEEHPGVATTYNNIGLVYRNKGSYEEALEYYRKSLAISIKTLGKEHPDVAINYNDIGLVYRYKGDHNASLEYYRKSLTIRLKIFGENHSDVATSYSNIGEIYYSKGQYDETMRYYQKALKIKKRILGKNHRDVATIYNNIGLVYYDQGYYDDALKYYQKSLVIIIKILGENNESAATTYHNIGLVYLAKGQFDNALEYYQKALSYKLKVYGENHPNVAITYDNIGAVYGSKGQYNNALEYHQKALKIYIKFYGKYHPDVAINYNNIGIIFFSKGHYDDALNYYQKSLAIIIKLYGENHPYVAEAYNSIGKVYYKKGQFDKALQYYQKSLPIRIKTQGKESLGVATTYHSMGSVFHGKGHYNYAIEYHQKSLAIRIKMLGKNHPYVANNYNDIGMAYLLQDRYDDALNYFQEGLNIRFEIYGNNHPSIARSYTNIGTFYQSTGQYDSALKYYQKAIEIHIRIYGYYHPSIAVNYNNIGVIYNAKNLYNNALEYYQKSLAIRIKTYGEDHPYIASDYHNIGLIQYSKNNYFQALHFYQQSMMALVKGFKDTNSVENPMLRNINSKIDLLITLTDKAYTLYHYYTYQKQELQYLTSSFETYQLAMDLADTLRFSYNREGSKRKIMKQAVNIYEGAMGVAYQLFETTQDQKYLEAVFSIAEKSKAALLLEGLKESGARQFGGVPDSLLKEEKYLKIDITFDEKKLWEAEYKKDTANIAYFQNNLFAKRRRLDSLIQHFEANYPKYHNLKYNYQITSVQEVQENIVDKNTALLEYFIADSVVYLFAITQNDLQVHQLPKDSLLMPTVQLLLETMNPDTIELKPVETYKQYTSSAYQLYQWLLEKPLKALPPHIKTLTIIPNQLLSSVPFELLLTKQPEIEGPAYGLNFLDYVLEEYAISYGYSATSLIQQQQAPKPTEAAIAFAGFAPAFNTNNKEAVIGCTENAWLPKLINNKKEVKKIRKLVGGTMFLDTHATKENFLQQVPKARILHLATHACMGDTGIRNLEQGYIYLSNGESINTYDIYNLEMQADMVILSACETGKGQWVKGEGIMSLSRAFAYAGSASMVMTLWSASDFSTPDLMIQFYEYLKKDLPKPQALQQAKLDYLRNIEYQENGHPFFWAPFIVSGNVEPVKISKPFPYWILWIAGGVLIVALVVLRLRNNEKRKMNNWEVRS